MSYKPELEKITLELDLIVRRELVKRENYTSDYRNKFYEMKEFVDQQLENIDKIMENQKNFGLSIAKVKNEGYKECLLNLKKITGDENE